MRVLTLTWNVGNAEPLDSQINLWCPAEGGDFDLVVVGTQENRYTARGSSRGSTTRGGDDDGDEDDDDDVEEGLEVNFSAKRVLPTPPPSDDKMGAWEMMISRRLGAAWGMCRMITLWEMRLVVFARKEHIVGESAPIRGVQSARSATGIGGVMGNKGGLVISMQFGQTSLCFVSAHLAAHSHKLAARNAMLQEILRETRNKIGTPELDVTAEFDHCFWMGDLNYRAHTACIPSLTHRLHPQPIADAPLTDEHDLSSPV